MQTTKFRKSYCEEPNSSRTSMGICQKYSRWEALGQRSEADEFPPISHFLPFSFTRVQGNSSPPINAVVSVLQSSNFLRNYSKKPCVNIYRSMKQQYERQMYSLKVIYAVSTLEYWRIWSWNNEKWTYMTIKETSFDFLIVTIHHLKVGNTTMNKAVKQVPRVTIFHCFSQRLQITPTLTANVTWQSYISPTFRKKHVL